jgi:DNA polymerase II small subunit/DNA polymerase delta subunit B
MFFQPLHPCLFPQSSRFSSFSRVTNPYEASFDGVTVLGHSGQPVTDIARQRLDCMPSAKTAVKADPAVPETGKSAVVA